MTYGKSLVLAREDVLRAARNTSFNGEPLEEPDFAVYEDEENGMVVRLPSDYARQDFFRQLYLILGEDVATSLAARKREPQGGRGTGVLYFPNVALKA